MLHLQELAKHNVQTQRLILTERLPAFLAAPCEVQVTYQVEAKDNIYLIHLAVSGTLSVICQRCLVEFTYLYANKTIIAVCQSDERAEQLLEQYECVVAPKGQVDLQDLVVDELHLYAPQGHVRIEDCDHEINQFLTSNLDAN